MKSFVANGFCCFCRWMPLMGIAIFVGTGALSAEGAQPPQDRFERRADQFLQKTTSREDFERRVRQLMHEFPQEPRVYAMLLDAAKGAEKSHARALLEEVLKSNASKDVKAEAKEMTGLLEFIGKPLNLQFTALDGRQIDLQKMKGKVVLVYFWATGCGPCMDEIPNLNAAYAKFHEKGLEILCVSFDQDKTTLEQVVKKKQMTWPQYFDGRGWKNKLNEAFGIVAIPQIWVVDKKGVLRDTEGRWDLTEKIGKMLAEP